MRGHAHQLGIDREVRRAAPRREQRRMRLAVGAVLVHRVLHRLARRRVLQLGGQQRHAVEEEYQVEAPFACVAVAELAGKRLPDGTSAAGNPLWLTLAVEELNLLDEDDFERADREFPDLPGDERLHQLLLSVIEALPADVEGLYGWLLARTEEIWGEAWARGFADLLALSRGGWRETDLQVLLPAVSGEAWNPARLAGLRRSFRGQLVRRGAQGQWDFAHSQTRLAIARRSLTDAAEVRRRHCLIADHLEALPRDDPLHESETMFHLIGADDRARAGHCYSNDLTGAELDGATQRLAEPIIAGEGDGPNIGLEWALSLIEAEGVEDAVTARVCHRFILDLCDAMENDTRLNTHHALLEPTRDVMQRLAAADPGNAESQRDLAASYYQVAYLMNECRRASEANEYLLRCRRQLRGMRERGDAPRPTDGAAPAATGAARLTRGAHRSDASRLCAVRQLVPRAGPLHLEARPGEAGGQIAHHHWVLRPGLIGELLAGHEVGVGIALATALGAQAVPPGAPH